MTDQEKRENTIKGLECCDAMHNGGEVKCADNCPYFLGYDGEINNNCRGALINDALALLKAQEPVEHGLWIRQKGSAHVFKCSACGFVFAGAAIAKYCPNCGAKMDGERRESE